MLLMILHILKENIHMSCSCIQYETKYRFFNIIDSRLIEYDQVQISKHYSCAQQINWVRDQVQSFQFPPSKLFLISLWAFIHIIQNRFSILWRKHILHIVPQRFDHIIQIIQNMFINIIQSRFSILYQTDLPPHEYMQ